MAGEIDVAYCNTQIDLWKVAIEKLSLGQEYTIGGIRNGRQLKRADLPEARNTLDYWIKKKRELESPGGTGIRVRSCIP